jgi:hypothetical protein
MTQAKSMGMLLIGRLIVPTVVALTGLAASLGALSLIA